MADDQNQNPEQEEDSNSEQEQDSNSRPAVLPEFGPDDVREIMHFDPFAKGLVEDEPEDEPEDESEGTPPAERETEGEVPVAREATPDYSERLATALENINTRLTAPAEPASRPAAPADPKTLNKQFEDHLDGLYNFNISPATVHALQSDDPGQVQEAVGKTMQMVAKLVHRNITKEMQGAFIEVLQKRIPAMIAGAQQQAAAQQQMNIDFYSHFPELSAPELGDVVRGTFQLMLKETPALKTQPWSPDFRDKLGNRVLKALGMQRQPQGQNSAPAKRAAPKANRMLNGRTSRPAGTSGGAGGPNTEADISSTLFG